MEKVYVIVQYYWNGMDYEDSDGGQHVLIPEGIPIMNEDRTTFDDVEPRAFKTKEAAKAYVDKYTELDDYEWANDHTKKEKTTEGFSEFVILELPVV